MGMKELGYTAKDVADGKRYLAEESRCLKIAQKSDLKAMEWAFRFGQKLWIDILKERRGTRNERTLTNYLKAVGFRQTPHTAYRYIDLYRAAKTLKTIKESGLSRAYLTRVGQTLWTDNPIFLRIADRLVINPIRRETEAKTLEVLDEVCQVVKDARARLKTLKSIKVLRTEPHGSDFMWEMDGCLEDCQKAVRIHARLEQDVARLTGRHDKAFTVYEGSEGYQVITPSDMGEGRTAKELILDAHRQETIRNILDEACESDHQGVNHNLVLGDALKILKDRTLFPERSVDCVLTDPPYSDEDYEPEREHTRVKHHAPATTAEAAELAASVARIILDRKINRSRFCWVQFCPLRKVHIFLPALLRAFKDAGFEPDFQVLVWDKCVPARVGGTETFGSQAEAILHLNLGRPLPQKDPNGSKIFSPIFRVQQPKKGKGVEPWKPVELLKKLLWLSLYGDNRSDNATKQRVLDPFAGRGSTGIAAMELGRSYALIEIDKDQHDIAKANLLMAMKGQPTSVAELIPGKRAP